MVIANKYVRDLTLTGNGIAIYKAEEETKIQEVGGNVITTPFTFALYLLQITSLLERTATTKLTKKTKYGGVLILTALYILGKCTKNYSLEHLQERFSTIPSSLISCTWKTVERLYDYRHTLIKTTLYATSFFLIKKGSKVGGGAILFLLTLRELRNRTTLISDRVQRNIDSLIGPLAIAINFFVIRSFFTQLHVLFTILGKVFPQYPRYVTGHSSLPFDPNCKHQQDPNSIIDFLRTKPTLVINYNYVRRAFTPALTSSYTKPLPAERLIEKTKDILSSIENDLGKKRFFELVLVYYKQREGLTQMDRDSITLIEKSLSTTNPEEQEQIKQELSQQDIQAQLDQWERMLSLPERIRKNNPTLQAHYEIAKEKKAAYEANRSRHTVDLHAEQEKLKNFFKNHFLSLLQQLKDGTFRQGGTLDIEAILKTITFIVNRAEQLFDPEESFHQLMVVMEKSQFCNQAIVDFCNTAQQEYDRFPSDAGTINGLKNRVYHMLRHHRLTQLTAFGQKRAKDTAAFFGKHVTNKLAMDTHQVNEELRQIAFEEHLTPLPFENSVLNELIVRILALSNKWREAYDNTINPTEMLLYFNEKLQTDPIFKAAVIDWKRNLADQFPDQSLATEIQNLPVEGDFETVKETKGTKETLKLFLFDMGVFEKDRHSNLDESRNHMPTTLEHLAEKHPFFKRVINRVYAPIPRVK